MMITDESTYTQLKYALDDANVAIEKLHTSNSEMLAEIEDLQGENLKYAKAISYMNSILSEEGVREYLSQYALLAAYDEILK